MDERDELVDRQLVDRLAKAGWNLDGWTRYPAGTVKVGLRRAPDTSGEPVRHIYGTDINDAIRKELERLEAEQTRASHKTHLRSPSGREEQILPVPAKKAVSKGSDQAAGATLDSTIRLTRVFTSIE